MIGSLPTSCLSEMIPAIHIPWQYWLIIADTKIRGCVHILIGYNVDQYLDPQSTSFSLVGKSTKVVRVAIKLL